MTLSFRPKA